MKNEKTICESKVAYDTAAEAYAMIKKFKNQPWHKKHVVKPTRAYRCPVCHKYHLTSQKEGRL
jgi:hypothetical protein